MKVLHLESNRYSKNTLTRLEEYCEVTYLNEEVSQSEFLNFLSKNSFNVIFTRLGLNLGKEELHTQNQLTYVVTPTTGLNHIDLGETDKRNIACISLKSETKFLANVKSTAEHTWSLLLMLVRNMKGATISTLNNKWDRKPFLADELNTKTLGIIGYGRLGKIIHKYANAFGMKVLLHDIDASAFEDSSKEFAVSKDELLSNSDFVILQVDYRPENLALMNEATFNLMKESAYFINTSRGEMVDEDALLFALRIGKIKGAAVDVLYGDSIWNNVPEKHPLVEFAKHNENLIITPHMGGYGRVSIEMTRDFVTDKFLNTINA